MKKLFLFIVFAVLVLSAQAQQLKFNKSVALYQAYDTTTFFFGIDPGTKGMYVDYTDFNGDDAVMYVEMGGADNQRAGKLTLYNSANTAIDSTVLNATSNTKTIRNLLGTRYTTSCSYIKFSDGFPTHFIAVTIKWNSVTTGTLKIYF